MSEVKKFQSRQEVADRIRELSNSLNGLDTDYHRGLITFKEYFERLMEAHFIQGGITMALVEMAFPDNPPRTAVTVDNQLLKMIQDELYASEDVPSFLVHAALAEINKRLELKALLFKVTELHNEAVIRHETP